MEFKYIDNKFSHLVIATIYSYLFYLGYIKFLHPVFEYYGYGILKYRINNKLMIVITLLISVLPIYFFNGIKQISSFLCVFIYYILYVPIVITYYFNLEGSELYLVYQQLLFMSGMLLLILADRVNLKLKLTINSNINLINIINLVTFFILCYIIIVYHNNLRFVSFDNVYEQRSSNKDFGKSNLLGYFFVWLSNAFIPLLLAFGLFSKKKILFFSGTFACIIVYMATAAKSVLIFPLIIFCLYVFLKNKNLNLAIPFIGLFISLIFVVIINLEFNIISSLFMMRTVGNGGSLTKQYHDYFLNNPKTYYTHLNIVNFLTNSYPYKKEALGQVIGKEYFSEEMNANANFWATDGIAALGDGGIIFSSFLLFIIFLFFNNVTKSYNKLFLILVLVPYLFSLLNTSLFSSIISGGALIIFLFLSFKSVKNNNFINENSYNSGSKTPIC